MYISPGKVGVGQGRLLQLDAAVQVFKEGVREVTGDLLQPVPHLLIARYHFHFSFPEDNKGPPLQAGSCIQCKIRGTAAQTLAAFFRKGLLSRSFRVTPT